MFEKARDIIEAKAGEQACECFSKIAGHLLSKGYKGGKHFFDACIMKIGEEMILRIRDDAEKYDPKELLLGKSAEESGNDFMIPDECIDYHYTMRINMTTIKFQS